jgi:hypothetical protein
MTSVTFLSWYWGVSCGVMSNNGIPANERDIAAEVRDEPGSVSASSANNELAKRSGRGRFSDVQGAARFPLKLPISVKSTAGASTTETQNISANGVLFQMESDMPVGSRVDFTISLPANVVGAEDDVQIDCRGRVVRSFEEEGRRGVGVVIDEYRFDRH